MTFGGCVPVVSSVVVQFVSGLAAVAVEEPVSDLGADFDIGRGALKLTFGGESGSLKRIANERTQVRALSRHRSSRGQEILHAFRSGCSQSAVFFFEIQEGCFSC